MLARLISARQVVLLYTSTMVHLFYYGEVYSRLAAASGLEGLPECLGAPYFPIWALIDVDYVGHEPLITSTSNVWPIQASSPNPTRWKSWSKQNGAAMLGLPLWDLEELMGGYVLSLFSLPSTDLGHVV